MNTNTENVMAFNKQPKWKMFINKFFKWHNISPELPDWAKDGIVTTVCVDLSFKDRLVILLTGRCSIRLYSACENIPGKVETNYTSFISLPPQFAEYK